LFRDVKTAKAAEFVSSTLASEVRAGTKSESKVNSPETMAEVCSGVKSRGVVTVSGSMTGDAIATESANARPAIWNCILNGS